MKGAKDMLHYLPGCDVRKNHREAMSKIQKYMECQGAVIESCCRVKESFLNEGDRIVQNCTLCQLILKETHPNNECLSLYEYVLMDKDFPWTNHAGEEIIVQDCWRTRDNRSIQDAIRQCLLKMNYTIIEMDENYSQTKYCGVWLNNPPVQECVDVAPTTFEAIIKNDLHLLSEEKQIQKMKDWVQHYPMNQILVYCNGCERGIKLGGMQPIHMVELIASGL